MVGYTTSAGPWKFEIPSRLLAYEDQGEGDWPNIIMRSTCGIVSDDAAPYSTICPGRNYQRLDKQPASGCRLSTLIFPNALHLGFVYHCYFN